MSETSPSQKSLVLYKNRAACVNSAGAKLDLILEDGKTVKVRPKDVQLLHPGPLNSLSELTPQTGELEVAWELLAGETTTLAELSELIYDAYTPATVWATWEEVVNGLYFYGTPDQITVRTKEELAEEQATRQNKIFEQQSWNDFIARLENNQFIADDERYLQEVVDLALEKNSKSRVLHTLGRAETSENAHALLLKLGYWDYSFNPHPSRFGITLTPPQIELPDLPEEERVDLTHLPAFAIDDAESNDPDDALSLDGNRLWVHVADVAALVQPESQADLEARGRAANLYLPEGIVSMLPPKATHLLGLGLADISPALSFGLDLNDDGDVVNVEVTPSWVRVQRLTYNEVETRLSEAPFKQFYELALANIARREANGAISIQLPEIKIRVIDKQVHIIPLPALKSRDLVREAMLLCGQALANFALENNIPFAFSTQEAPEQSDFSEGLAGMFAQRLVMRPSQLKSVPGSHAGLGLDLYAQATSPLRRYLDLVIHQQLRAFLRNAPLLDTNEIMTRVGSAQAVGRNLRRAERLANKHWTLVYLLQNPNWRGQGVILEKRGHRDLILIPELSLEVRLHLRQNLPLNTSLPLALKSVNLAELDAYFQVE